MVSRYDLTDNHQSLFLQQGSNHEAVLLRSDLRTSGGSPYTALAAFIAGYHLISTVLGMLVGGPAGAALMSDWGTAAFFLAFFCTRGFRIRIGKSKTILVLLVAIAALVLAEWFTHQIWPPAPEQAKSWAGVACSVAMLALAKALQVLVCRYIWPGFRATLAD